MKKYRYTKSNSNSCLQFLYKKANIKSFILAFVLFCSIQPVKGAIDDVMDAYTIPIIQTYVYDENVGIQPFYIDFSYLVNLPANPDLNSLNVTITGTLTNGTLTAEPGNNYRFLYTPTPDSDPTKVNPSIIGVPSTVTFSVSYSSGVTWNSSNTLTIKVEKYQRPPGYVDEELENCYGTMGTVAFDSQYRFLTSSTIGTSSTDRFLGMTNPMIGDLNGDGKPEIVVIGNADSSTGDNITIISGQNGRRLTNKTLPSEVGSSWHSSPSYIALVNSDPDVNNLGEVIVAYQTDRGTSSYRGYLESYEITSATDFTLKLKWKSNYQYSADTDFKKPIPQILDVDGDGEPEVIVYNRIFSARTGKLKMTLETLKNDGTGAYVGADYNTTSRGSNDRFINFSYTYDIDQDGKYDLVAGGKVYYDINFAAAVGSETTGVLNDHYKIAQISGVPDGRTGVADINGDGIPDVVVVKRVSTTQLRIVVWNPDFLYIDSDGSIKKKAPGTNTPYLLADKTITINDGSYGNNSYVFIGDIDGRRDHKTGKMLPEIAILSGDLTTNSVTVHPNVASEFPSMGSEIPSSGDGVLFGMTWDDDPSIPSTNYANKLKLSFVLEHDDNSVNTTFAMYDFDNDGMQEICYRDQKLLRIIKAKVPYVYLSDTKENRPDVILFRQSVVSRTGFEGPVIADISGLNSAEMVVMGHSSAEYYGYIYAVGNKGDKFAPAMPVWNQFMYSPFKINADLTVPTGPAPNPLNIYYKRKRTKANGNEEILEIRPFNGTMIQATRSMELDTYEGKFYEPIVFFPDGYITDARIDGNNIKFKVGNRSGAKSTIPVETPVQVYKTSVVNSAWTSKKTLSDLGVSDPIAGGEVSVELSFPITDAYGIFFVRLSDDTTNPQAATPDWSYGTNDASDANPDLGIGAARRYLRDCRWADNMIRVAKFVLNDDAATIQEFTQTQWLDILGNDIFPDDMPAFTLSNAHIISGPIAGTLEFNGQPNYTGQVRYTHTGSAQLADGIDQFTYQFTYTDPVEGLVTRTATVYIYILQNNPSGFSACINESNATLRLRELPFNTNLGVPQVAFHWYDDMDQEILGNPQSTYTIPVVTTNMKFYIQPEITGGAYMGVDFPKGEVDFYAVPVGTELKWTGKVNINWNNPQNWTDGAGNVVAFTPRSCVDVILPTNDASNAAITKYPSLYEQAFARDITIENRAMIANTHYLSYNDASLEVNFGTSERDRWVMYSAPFAKMYSGDFMLLNTDNYPIKSAVYMSLFQMKNPDNTSSVAAKHQFSMTFSKIEQELTLGTGFILYVDSSKDPLATSFRFSSALDRYEYYYANTWIQGNILPKFSEKLDREATLPVGLRKANNRFITETAPILGNQGIFQMSMPSDNISGSNVIMVTNPFNAYLKIDQFLTENSTELEQAYMVWNGTDQPRFIEYMKDRTVNDTYITSNGTTVTGQLISPHQSFFVVRKSGGSIPTSLKFAPESMTLTTLASAPYPLKSVSENTANSIQINVAYGNTNSSTLIVKSNVSEHMPKLFLNDDQVGIDIYTIIDDEAVSINKISDLSKEIEIGIRLKEGGEVILNFTGIETVDSTYDIYLKDGKKLLNIKDIDNYIIMIERPLDITDEYFEVNDRLSLIFKKKTDI